MHSYYNGALVGMGDSINDKNYQEKLAKQTADILKGKDSVSANELKNNTIFKDTYKNLTEEGKKKFDAILSLDGDANNVSEKELKTLLTIMDAELSQEGPVKNRFLMNNEISVDSNNGIYQATDKEIKIVYDNIKTNAQRQAEAVAEQKKDAQLLADVADMVKDYDITNGSDLTKALTIISKNISRGSSKGIMLYKIATDALFKGNLKNADTYRDGGSMGYQLKDGTKIFHNFSLSQLSENGFVTITKPDGTVEKYNPEGELIKE